MGFLNKIFNNSNQDENQSKMDWIPLTVLNQLDEIISLSHEKPVIIFKHSTRCSISRFVLKQFENEFDLSDNVTPYFLDLLEHRDISNEIAHRFGVVHQSPQLIVIKNGNASYNTSHENISAVALKSMV